MGFFLFTFEINNNIIHLIYQKELIMPKQSLQKGTLVCSHRNYEDFGVDEYNIYIIVGFLDDNGTEICTLKSYNTPYYRHYRSVPTNEIIESDNYSVLALDNKPFSKKYHKKGYSLVNICVIENKYEIILSEKSSDNVFDDIKNIINNMFNKNNIHKRIIELPICYKISWSESGYITKPFKL